MTDSRQVSWGRRLLRVLLLALVVFGVVVGGSYLLGGEAFRQNRTAEVRWNPPPTPSTVFVTPPVPYAPLDPAIVAAVKRSQPYQAQELAILPGVPPIGAYIPLQTGRTLGQLQTPQAQVMPPLPTVPALDPAPDSGILATPTPALSDLGGPAAEPYAGEGCAPRGMPTGGVLTQYFHAWHSGVDYGIPVGTPVLATHSAQVIFAGWSTVGYGNLVILQNGSFITYYAHLSSFNVVEGQAVGAGSVLAWSGNTGNSTGPHIHYEVRINDVPVDPLTFESRGYPWC
ncbi:MAG: peptidoglycan DD-metalloendopeptidase family protein [Anaerolineae bacterium]|nr:peptidoglycan DD-metalloendopeptidase family protein [Anaerolineae bacterium]